MSTTAVGTWRTSKSRAKPKSASWSIGMSRANTRLVGSRRMCRNSLTAMFLRPYRAACMSRQAPGQGDEDVFQGGLDGTDRCVHHSAASQRRQDLAVARAGGQQQVDLGLHERRVE